MAAPDGLLEQWVKEYENDPEFLALGLASDLIEQVLVLLGSHGQTWLASKMGVSSSSVSRLLSASPHLSLLNIARLAVALGVKPRIVLEE